GHGQGHGQGRRLFTLISYGFVHYNLTHLLWNISFGAVFSKVVYPALGAFNWALVFVAGLVGGAIFHFLTSDNQMGIIGCSAGVAAWLGAGVLFTIKKIPMPAPFNNRGFTIFFIVFFIGFNFIGAVVNNIFTTTPISNYGHLGGLLFGFVTAQLLIWPREKKLRRGS
ncbi:MAG: rhomboid family intramembrane serine protease, partial [Alphaproteobacteria bacterium]|nr:rhomboid family intramembrane serine protease [Alphaproteobacteria bacterium]